MSWHIVGLALLASVLWGAANYFGGGVGREVGAKRAAFAIQLVVFICLVPLSFLVSSRWTWTDFGWGALASLGGIVGFLAMYAGMATGSMGVIAKLLAAMMVLIPLVFGIAQGERPTSVEAVGVFLVLASILVLSMKSGSNDSRFTHTDRRGIVLGLVAGVGFGLAVCAQGQTDSGDGSVVLLGYRGFIALMLAAYFLVRNEPLRIPRTSLKGIAASGGLSAVGDTAFIIALQRGELSVVPAIAALHRGVTALAARYLGQERIRATQITGICIGLVGIVVMKL